jgi:hypothetical protein
MVELPGNGVRRALFLELSLSRRNELPFFLKPNREVLKAM